MCWEGLGLGMSWLETWGLGFIFVIQPNLTPSLSSQVVISQWQTFTSYQTELSLGHRPEGIDFF